MEDRWSMETRAIGPRMEPDVDFADFPIGDDIQKHILILKAFAEETGWRVLELNPDEISDNDEIKLPDLLSLPKLEEDDNADVFLKLHEDASLDEKKIGDRAVQ